MASMRQRLPWLTRRARHQMWVLHVAVLCHGDMRGVPGSPAATRFGMSWWGPLAQDGGGLNKTVCLPCGRLLLAKGMSGCRCVLPTHTGSGPHMATQPHCVPVANTVCAGDAFLSGEHWALTQGMIMSHQLAEWGRVDPLWHL